MPRQTSRLNPLAARKRLLLMESELNRATLEEAIGEWKDEFDRSREQLTRLTSIASLAGKVASALPAMGNLFRRRPGTGSKKAKLPFWLNGVMTGTSLWLLVRSFRRKP